MHLLEKSFVIVAAGLCPLTTLRGESAITAVQNKMSTRNLPGDKGRPARKTVNLSAESRTSRKCGSLEVSQPCGPPQPATGIALSFFALHIIRFSTGSNLNKNIFPGLRNCSPSNQSRMWYTQFLNNLAANYNYIAVRKDTEIVGHHPCLERLKKTMKIFSHDIRKSIHSRTERNTFRIHCTKPDLIPERNDFILRNEHWLLDETELSLV
jgi:hypothetical protein